MARTARRGRERYPSGKPRPEQADGVGNWQRAFKLAKAQVIDPRWGSQTAKLLWLGEISQRECEAADRWADLMGRYDRIEGLPPRSAHSPIYEHAYNRGRSVANGRVTKSDVELKETVIKSRKAVMAMNFAALNVLNDVVLLNESVGLDGRAALLRAALRTLIQHWRWGK